MSISWSSIDWLYTRLEDYNKVMQPLFKDLHSASNGLRLVGGPFWRRIYVRSLVATIEADIFQRKQLAIVGNEQEAIFSNEELAVLKEEQYSVQSNGKIKVSTKFIPLAANYRLSFELAGRVIHSPFQLKVDGGEWDDFLRCIELRNNITHPRSSEDIEVSEADAKMAQRVSSWCAENGVNFFREAADEIDA